MSDVVIEIASGSDMEGPKLLNAWLAENGVSSSTVALAVGVTSAAISGYRNCTYRPVMIVALKLERYTCGQVPYRAWLTWDERNAVKAVVPWSDL